MNQRLALDAIEQSSEPSRPISRPSVLLARCVYPPARPRRRLAALSSSEESPVQLSSSVLRSIRLDPRIQAKNLASGTVATPAASRSGGSTTSAATKTVTEIDPLLSEAAHAPLQGVHRRPRVAGAS